MQKLWHYSKIVIGQKCKLEATTGSEANLKNTHQAFTQLPIFENRMDEKTRFVSQQSFIFIILSRR